MALIKKITLQNGIVVNYHRITSITSLVNQQTTIEVSSYTSKKKRDEESAWLKSQRAGDDATTIDVWVETTLFNMPYDAEMNVVNAYEWLKAQPEYAGASDTNY